MNEQITLRELMEMTPEKCTGRKMGKTPLKAQVQVIASYESDGYTLLVFKTGTVLAEYGKRWTTFSLHDCGGYVYELNEADEWEDVVMERSFEAEFFMDQPWTIRVMMMAEDRMEANNDRAQYRYIAQHSEIPPRPAQWLRSREISPEDEFIRKEWILEMLNSLTEKQREVIELWMQGCTQQEIADVFSLNQTSVSSRIKSGLKSLKTTFAEEVML